MITNKKCIYFILILVYLKLLDIITKLNINLSYRGIVVDLGY